MPRPAARSVPTRCRFKTCRFKRCRFDVWRYDLWRYDGCRFDVWRPAVYQFLALLFLLPWLPANVHGQPPTEDASSLAKLADYPLDAAADSPTDAPTDSPTDSPIDTFSDTPVLSSEPNASSLTATANEPISERISEPLSGVERIWRIRTHALDDPGPRVRTDLLDIQRSEDGEWRTASADELRRAAGLRHTLIYVHGNRGADALAVARGTELARRLAARPGADPFQLVIWSWPSGKIFRGRRDFLHKSERTDTEAWYLAGLLQTFPAEAQVSILGYSYGARVVTGAAHWLAGGRFEDRELPQRDARSPAPRTPPQAAAQAPAQATAQPTAHQSPLESPRESPHSPRLRVVLAAPAMHWHWLGENSVQDRALEAIDRLTILYNPSDPALRWFKLVYPCERPQALGRVGIDDQLLGAAAARVEQWNIVSAVGRNHDEELLLRSSAVIDIIGTALMDHGPLGVVEPEAAKR
jgi:hypothetical protein